MAKLTLSTITSGYLGVTATNANFASIVAAFDNTLSRDGTTPNSMGANLDMNSHKVINLSDAVNSADAVNLRQLNAASIVSTLPSQTSNANKVLKTDGTVAGWVTISSQLGSDLSAAANRFPYFDTATTMAVLTADQLIDKVADNATAETAPDVADLVLLDDVSANAGRTMTLQNLLKVINTLAADGTPDVTADYVVTYDASAAAAKKVLLNKLCKQPTRQVLTSGTGATYTTPTGATRINVRLVGGGGGGGGATANNGTAGNNTTFSTLTGSSGAAGGGNSGSGGNGGAAAGGDINIPGGGGSAGQGNSGASLGPAGGPGGNSAFGGGGKGGGNGNDGTAAATNSGGGGGGAGGDGATNSGGGGGAGGYVEKLFLAPSATYTYTVGAAANGGAAGTHAGGNGAAGIIIVDEYYN